MSKYFNNHKMKICTKENKRCFEEGKANLILALSQSSTDNKRQEQRKYYCPACRYWHLTSLKSWG